MPHISEAPAFLQDYTVLGHTSVLGVQHTGLENRDNRTRIVMPERSFRLIDEHPEIGALIGRVASFAAAHDGYRDSRSVSQHEDVETLRHADVSPEWDKHNYASVYRDHASNQIIKAYDLSADHEPYSQYAVMSSLAHRLNDQSATAQFKLSASEQFAMISVPETGHKTIVMQNVGGISILEALVTGSQRSARGHATVKEATTLAQHTINKAVRSQIPVHLRPFLNDVTRNSEMHNVHIEEPSETLTPETVLTAISSMREARIIDQPGSTPTTRILGQTLRTSRLAKLLH